MQLRSLSIAVPTKGIGNNGRGCPNNCAFCVSALDDETYPDLISGDSIRAENEYVKKLEFCSERNFESMVITGTGEPLMNMGFIIKLSRWNNSISRKFKWIDVQTSGVTLTKEKLDALRDIVGVTGISLSLSSIFNDDLNANTNEIPNALRFNIQQLCSLIKSSGFNLRLSLNMWSHYNYLKTFDDIFNRARDLGANQITFRILYQSKDLTLPQNIWIKDHPFKGESYLKEHIETYGEPLEPVSFGAMRYNVDGISTILDTDCMSTTVKDELRYLVLRQNCKLYTKWSTSGSLLF